jgi:hypothetical protein
VEQFSIRFHGPWNQASSFGVRSEKHMTVGNHVTTALRLARDDPEVLKGFYSPDKWNHHSLFDKEDRFRSKFGPQYQL